MISMDTENNRIYGVGYARLHCINSTDMTEIWGVDLPDGSGDGGRSAPTIVNDSGDYSIYFGTLLGPEFGTVSTGQLYSFDYDGNLNWNISVPGGVRAHVSWSPKTDYIYFPDFYQYYGSQTNHIYALNRTTGEQIWKVTGPRNDHILRPLTIVGDNIVLHTNNNYRSDQDYLYILNSTNGEFFGGIPYTGDALGGSGFLVQFDLGEGELIDSKYLWGDYRDGYVDENALTCYGLDTCSTPKYYNSPMDMNDTEDTWIWSNFTWSNNTITAGTTIGWKIYYNDTYGNIAATDIHAFTVRELTEPIVLNPSPNNGEVGVPIDTSSLSVVINTPKSDSFSWTIETSPDVGSCFGDNEYNETKTCSISNLNYDTTYTWSVNAVNDNSGMWTNKTYTFTTESEPATWWNNSWLYRKQITIDHNGVDDDLINFPVLIEFTDADVGVHAQTDGDDIVFTDDYGIKLNHEIELYETSSPAHLVAWVNVPFVSSTEDTVLYMYYGNLSVVNQENVEEVWGNSYLIVQHLDETSGIHYDSTKYDNDGTNLGSTQDTTGKIDGANDFDGIDDNINIYDSETSHLELQDVGNNNDYSIGMWIKTTQENGENTESAWYSEVVLFELRSEKTDGTHVPFSFGITDGYIEIGRSTDYITSAEREMGTEYISDDSWHYVVVSVMNDDVDFYVDGNLDVSKTYSTVTGDCSIGLDISNMGIASRWKDTGATDDRHCFDGIIDEARLSNITRSAGWISTEYNNQNNPSGFYSIGSEEQNGGPVCETDADTNGDGKIDMPEIMAYIGRWKLGEFLMPDLMKAIGFWKAGEGC